MSEGSREWGRHRGFGSVFPILWKGEIVEKQHCARCGSRGKSIISDMAAEEKSIMSGVAAEEKSIISGVAAEEKSIMSGVAAEENGIISGVATEDRSNM